MTTHHLKTWPEFFDAVADGRKTFDVRKFDRDFRLGDTLALHKWCPRRGYLGTDERWEVHEQDAQTVTVKVIYVLLGMGIEPGYVVMGIKPEGEADHG